MVSVKIECNEVKDLEPFTREGGGRRGGLLYFHRPLGQSNLVLRVVTKHTDSNWLKNEINDGRIYLPTEQITCEKS